MEKRLSDLIIPVEQDLTSQSTTSVPSVAAVKAALAQVPADNLGNHLATQNLDLNGHDLVSSSGIVQVDSQLRVNNAPHQDMLYFKGGPGGAGSRAALAFDTTDVGFGGNVSARIDFVDDGAYGAHILFETRTGSGGIETYEQLRIQTNGNVGVGTPTPSQKLEVLGNVKAMAFMGDGSQLTGISQVTVEADLSSNSATHVPSVQAVRTVTDAASAGIAANASGISALQLGKADLVNGTVPVPELPLATAAAPGIVQAGPGLLLAGSVLSTVATSNVTVQTPASVFPQPYPSLESAFAGYTALTYADVTTRTTCIQAKTLTIGANVSLSSYVKSEAATVYIPDGLTVSCVGSYYIENVVFDVPANAPASTGRVNAPGLRSAAGESLDANTFSRCRVYADLNVSGTLILVDTYVENLVSSTTAAATIYLYGNSVINNNSARSPSVVVIDRTQHSIVPLLPFPVVGAPTPITLQTGSRYFRDGSILQYAGKNNASSTAVAFSSADTVNWQLISSSGFTPAEVSALKGGFSVFETVGDSPDGSVPVHTPYNDFTLVSASPNKTLNIHANSDAGWYFSTGDFTKTQYLNGNGNYISIGGGTLTFSYGVTIQDFTLSAYSIANWKLPSYQAAYLYNPNTLYPLFTVINPGDITNSVTCAQLINSNIYGQVMIGNTAVTLRDSYVMQFTYQSSSAFAATSARVYLYGRSKFGAFNYESARRTKVYDYRPYKDALTTNVGALKFTEDTFLRLVTPAGAAVNVEVDTTNFVPMAQCRLTIPATAGIINLSRNIRAYNDLVPGVENVLYLTVLANNYAVCYINQPATVTGTSVVVVPDLSGNSATSVPSVAAVAAYVAAPKTYFASAAIRNAVAGGAFANGELQGSSPAGSTFGMRFADTTYQYAYGFAAADTDGTTLTWVRTAKA